MLRTNLEAIHKPVLQGGVVKVGKAELLLINVPGATD